MSTDVDLADGGSERIEQVSERVILAVADAKGVDPCDLDTPLYDVVDPDALNKIFGSADRPRTAGRIIFTMAGCEVVVHGDGDVDATPAGEETSADASSMTSTE